MIKRIVKLQFREEEIDNFIQTFEDNKSKILASEGCEHVELWQDVKDKQTFFTYSLWNSEDDLNAYRQSQFFKEVWAITKTRFTAKPVAWSVNKISSKS